MNELRGIDAQLFSRSVDILVSRLRQKLEFLTDDSIERGVRVLSLLEDIADEEAALPDKKNEAAEERDERQ